MKLPHLKDQKPVNFPGPNADLPVEYQRPKPFTLDLNSFDRDPSSTVDNAVFYINTQQYPQAQNLDAGVQHYQLQVTSFHAANTTALSGTALAIHIDGWPQSAESWSSTTGGPSDVVAVWCPANISGSFATPALTVTSRPPSSLRVYFTDITAPKTMGSAGLVNSGAGSWFLQLQLIPLPK